jgi:hypothetical protein
MKQCKTVTVTIFLIFSSMFAKAQSRVPDTVLVTGAHYDHPYKGMTEALHNFVCFKRFQGYADPVTHKGRFSVDSSDAAKMYFRIDSNHVYLGDSSYTIMRVLEGTPYDLAIITVKDRGKTPMDTGELPPFITDSIAEWRFDIDSIKERTGIYHIMVSGHRWKEFPTNPFGKVWNGFALYYFEAKRLQGNEMKRSSAASKQPGTTFKWENTYSFEGMVDSTGKFHPYHGEKKTLVLAKTGLRLGNYTINFIGSNQYGDTAFYTFAKGTVLFTRVVSNYKEKKVEHFECRIVTANDTKQYQLLPYSQDKQ